MWSLISYVWLLLNESLLRVLHVQHHQFIQILIVIHLILNGIIDGHVIGSHRHASLKAITHILNYFLSLLSFPFILLKKQVLIIIDFELFFGLIDAINWSVIFNDD